MISFLSPTFPKSILPKKFPKILLLFKWSFTYQ
jgi:hypothetical protein